MKNILLPLLCSLFLGLALPAHAAQVRPHPAFSLNVPDGWESSGTGGVHQAPQSVRDVLDCANEDPGEIKLMGWKLLEDGRFEGAYCISYQRRGMGRLREILRNAVGDEAKKAADKFIDSFASKLNDEYGRKRKMTISDLSADLMKADNDLIMVMDGKVSGGGRQFLRGLVVFLHGDGLLNVSTIHDVRAQSQVKQALDAIPVSVSWQ